MNDEEYLDAEAELLCMEAENKESWQRVLKFLTAYEEARLERAEESDSAQIAEVLLIHALQQHQALSEAHLSRVEERMARRVERLGERMVEDVDQWRRGEGGSQSPGRSAS